MANIKEIRSTSEAMDSRQPSEAAQPVIPILIVPGFMSSSLEIMESSIRPKWVGKRLWLSLPRMGLSAYNRSGGLWKPDKDNKSTTTKEADFGLQLLRGALSLGEADPSGNASHIAQQLDEYDERKLGNAWLRHFMLKGPETEADGVHLKPVQGLGGVDYLSHERAPGLDVIMMHATYVFNPVIKALSKAGFELEKTLDAATYDWRFAPQALQRLRDGDHLDNYFERTIQQVETMNTGRGVAVLGHSMGNKVVQYFLEYAKRERGQAWLDEHVHTFIACGAPFLGAPQGMRSVLHGERLGLEAFMSKEEALVIGRNYSSMPWLFPTGLLQERSFINVRKQGVLEIVDLHANLPLTCLKSHKNAAVLGFEVSWGVGRGGSSLDSQSSIRLTAAGTMSADFDEDSNALQFGGPSSLPPAAAIRVIVKEKGPHAFDAKTTRSPWGFLNKAVGELLDGATKLTQAMKHQDGTSIFAVARVATDFVNIADLMQRPKDEQGFVYVSLPLIGGGGNVSFSLRWLDFEAMCLAWMGPEWCPSSFADAPYICNSRTGSSYAKIGIPEVFAADGCYRALKVWKDYYLDDPLYDNTGYDDAPPIRRVLAVHGTETPTEIEYVFKVETFRRKISKEHTRFSLDSEAELLQGVAPFAWNIEGGIIFNNGTELDPCGDGSVTIQSMEHCSDWKDTVDVSIVRLPKAGHREMLADARFHQLLIDSFGPNR